MLYHSWVTCIALTAHLSSDAHFMCLMAMYGWWMLYWTAQVVLDANSPARLSSEIKIILSPATPSLSPWKAPMCPAPCSFVEPQRSLSWHSTRDRTSWAQPKCAGGDNESVGTMRSAPSASAASRKPALRCILCPPLRLSSPSGSTSSEEHKPTKKALSAYSGVVGTVANSSHMPHLKGLPLLTFYQSCWQSGHEPRVARLPIFLGWEVMIIKCDLIFSVGSTDFFLVDFIFYNSF